MSDDRRFIEGPVLTSGHRKLTWSGIILLNLSSVCASAEPLHTGEVVTDISSDSCRVGLSLAAEYRFAAARPLLLDCLDHQGEQLPVLIALTMMALEENHDAEALDWASRTVTAFPDSADALYWHGRALFEIGDQGAARRSWETALQSDTDHLPTLRSLAALLLAEGDERPAYGLLLHVARIGGAEPVTLKTLSQLASKRALWRVALSHWDHSMQMESPSAGDLRHASELAIMAGDTAYAVRAAATAVGTDGSAESYSVLGEALFASQRIIESIPVMQRALVADSTLSRTRFHLANAYELVGRFDDADVEFLRYLREVPDDPVGFFNYAVHLDALGRTAEALRAADRASALAPSDSSIQLLRVDLLEKNGEIEVALARLEEVMASSEEQARRLAGRRRLLLDALGDDAEHQGMIFLQHIATPDSTALRLIQEDLVYGTDFTVVATRYSVAPAAAKGGEIGWVRLESMSEEFRELIAELKKQEISPPVESGGLYHIFKRVR